MPRFFFDFSDGGTVIHDDEGLDLPDLDRAKSEAIAALPDFARESRSGSAKDEPWQVTSIVRTEAGQPVFRATLSLDATKLP